MLGIQIKLLSDDHLLKHKVWFVRDLLHTRE